MSGQIEPRIGQLNVTVSSPSQFLLSGSLPYVVRDARHTVVHQGTTGDAPADLLEGLYSVAVVTPRGERSLQLVQIRPAETTELVFGTDEVTPSPPGQMSVESPPGEWQGSPRPHPTTPNNVEPVDAEPPLPGSAISGWATPAVLISTANCQMVVEDARGWRFAAVGNLEDVPTAVFRIAGSYHEMSLPLIPYSEHRGCRIDVVWDREKPKLRMSFDPQRPVAGLVDGLLRHNEALAGHALLEDATYILAEKYEDPSGAALGGLTLHRFGLLTYRQSWMENLARDFPWLPDGSILLAAILENDENEGERHRGLELLLSAARRRPIYTDGLSLAIELLRRWPDELSKSHRYQLLDQMTDWAAYADWDSINLSVVLS
ncbi:MAG TPA: hypothetical protein VGL05_15600 [Kribbella sp.]